MSEKIFDFGRSYSAVTGSDHPLEYSFAKMQAAMKEAEAIHEQSLQATARAFGGSGITVIVNPALKDNEYMVSPAVYEAVRLIASAE